MITSTLRRVQWHLLSGPECTPIHLYHYDGEPQQPPPVPIVHKTLCSRRFSVDTRGVVWDEDVSGRMCRPCQNAAERLELPVWGVNA